MRVALLSDIHSNLHALEAVLKHLETVSYDKLVVLGDIVGYNAYPSECLALVKDHADLALLGNHDAAALDLDQAAGFNDFARAGAIYSSDTLTREDRAYLQSLAPRADVTWNGMTFTFVHASCRDPLHEYVFPSGAPDMLDWLTHHLPDSAPRLVAQGHTHVPMFFTPTARRANPLYLLNPGSVGQPRDGDPRAAWALFDTDTRTPTFERTPYAIEDAARAIEHRRLPQALATRLFAGR